ncbi:hypothetical protein, partial [Treponema sp. R80B11-R83G3]
KEQQIKILSEEYFLKDDISSELFDILLHILKDEEKKKKYVKNAVNKYFLNGKLVLIVVQIY